MKLRVEYISRPYKNKVYRYPFLVTSYRDEQGRPRKKVICNLSHLPEYVVQLIDRALRTGEEGMACLVGIGEIKLKDAIDFGDMWAAWKVVQKLRIPQALGKLELRHRFSILAMILDRVVSARPHSKRALWSLTKDSAFMLLEPIEQYPSLDQWYKALDALAEIQKSVEKQLFQEGSKRVFLYDITSSYFEGTKCPLAQYGYSRDNKPGKLQILIGLLCNSEGRPLCARVFEGNIKDDTTVLSQLKELQQEFGVEEIVFVGDRGMITTKRIEELEEEDFCWLKYITALKRQDMMHLAQDPHHPLDPSLFDQHNLVELCDEGRRYVLCFNPFRQAKDKEVRESLLAKTEQKLAMIARNVKQGRWKRKEVIARKLYRWLDHWNMGRFFEVEYDEGYFQYSRKEDEIQRYACLDGCYVIVTNVSSSQMDKEEVVERYKSLAMVEQAFRTMKTTELEVRPIRHWNPKRVQAHVFVCMLAYLVVWEVRRRLAPVLRRDPSNRQCEADSLREVWEKLRKIKIGTFSVGGMTIKDLTTISAEQKKILRLLGAAISKKTKQALLQM